MTETVSEPETDVYIDFIGLDTTIHDMRKSHYVIFCHSKKQLVIVFRGGKHNRNWLVLV